MSNISHAPPPHRVKIAGTSSTQQRIAPTMGKMENQDRLQQVDPRRECLPDYELLRVHNMSRRLPKSHVLTPSLKNGKTKMISPFLIYLY